MNKPFLNIAVIFYLFLCLLYSQESYDVVILKNGKEIRGEIIKGGGNKDYFVQIKTQSGGFETINMRGVETIKRNVVEAKKGNTRDKALPSRKPKVTKIEQTFKNDNLKNLSKDKERDAQITLQVEQKKIGFRPKLGLVFGDLGASVNIGGGIGYGNSSQWLGVEGVVVPVQSIYFDYIFSLLGIYERSIRKLKFQAGIGWLMDKYKYPSGITVHHSEGFGVRIAFGKLYNLGKFSLRPNIELNLGIKDMYNSGSGSSAVNIYLIF